MDTFYLHDNNEKFMKELDYQLGLLERYCAKADLIHDYAQNEKMWVDPKFQKALKNTLYESKFIVQTLMAQIQELENNLKSR